MARKRAIEAAVEVLEKEGTSVAFGVPGAAINPLHAALRERGSIRHILARHVEGASHMAEGYTRARAGQGYGVDHVTVAEGLGCKALRVRSRNEFKDAFARARALMAEHQVPVVLEFNVERVTNVSMGTLDDVSGTVLETGAWRIDRAPGEAAPTPADGVEARP